MSQEITNETLQLRKTNNYNLRHPSLFTVLPVHSVCNGIEFAAYLGPKIWKMIPSGKKTSTLLQVLNRELRHGIPDYCPRRL